MTPPEPVPHLTAQMGIFAQETVCLVAVEPGKQLLLTQNIGWKKDEGREGPGRTLNATGSAPWS